ncbi:hypothetical protein [Pontixanthobacter sp. CEM42]|uniref:hypothetical protein n=1 Tax=Pontixanthobacter sp. CEM42 TaxID=2792077 RepID=UPI001ADF3F2C|nr:hypothetical protein [Pontixanthobacter sp. CEM42]
MRKVLKRVGIALGVLTIGALMYFYPLMKQFIRFNPMVTAAASSEPADKAEAQQQDFEYLAQILDYDRSFAPPARVTFTQRLETLRQESSALSDAQFFMATHELMAIADNAHTSSDTVSAFRQFNRSGLDFYNFADGMYVVRAHRSHEGLLGRKLVSIDGNDTESVLASLAKYSGGPIARRNLISLYFVRSPDLLHAAELASSPTSVTYVLEGPNGQQSEHMLEALPSAAETEFAYRHPYHTLRPDPLTDEDGDWVRVLGGEETPVPITFRDDGDLVLSTPLGDGRYIRVNYLQEYPDQPVETELLEALQEVPNGGFPFIVVDLRWNPGGDLGHAIPFAKRIGETVAANGKVYVITGPQTFSAAIVTAALIKQYAPQQTMIIGEPMGDRPQFWAERGQPFILPNSGYYIGYATGFHDWERPCGSEIEYCFPPAQREAAEIESLSLDQLIQPTFADYATGNDLVLDWVLARH